MENTNIFTYLSYIYIISTLTELLLLAVAAPGGGGGAGQRVQSGHGRDGGGLPPVRLLHQHLHRRGRISTLYLRYIYTVSTLYLHCIYTVSTLHLHCIYTVSTSTLYLHNIYNVSTQYLHCNHQRVTSAHGDQHEGDCTKTTRRCKID